MEVRSPTELLFFSTVLIEGVDALGEDQGATGCLFMYTAKASPSGGGYAFLVTCRHVVEGMVSGQITFSRAIRGQPLMAPGISVSVHPWLDGWTYHPDPKVDLAVRPLHPLEEAAGGFDAIFRTFLNVSMIPGC